MESMLENLNPEQRVAVETTTGPVLVLSGAGTGKTRVLIARIAYILANNMAQPWQILALTFTNKAANEMKQRVKALVPKPLENPTDIWMGTFHSICLRILRYNAEHAGMRRDFLIFGEDEQKTVLKNVFANMGLDTKTYSPGEWVEKISSIKDKGLGYKPAINIQKIYDAYNAELARMNAVDFGDIILKVLELFTSVPDVLERYHRQFRYIMVDEFQDTNNAQHQFLKMMAAGCGNICCVGDDDQSIYSWRGAEIKHILNFEKDYDNPTIVRLETNYRSTGNILGAANSLIRHNTGRLGKDLRTAPGCGDGEPVYVMTLPSDWDEARMVSASISRNGSEDDYSKYAVLIRAGSLSRLFEEEFAQKGIPYRLVGATKFYDRMEIRDAIAYLRLLVYPFDDLSFMRVISKPRRGFGNVALEKLRASGKPMMDALRIATLSGKQKDAAHEFLRSFDFDWDSMSPMDAAEKLLTDSGYIKMWADSKDIDAPDRMDNIKELISNVISKYDSMAEFLEHAALMMTDDNDTEDGAFNNNAVSIMTIHAAKGLEFDTVFLPAWEEGIFPNQMASEAVDGIEEERRLAYVAITRGRKRVVISNAMSRMIFGERKFNPASRFISEMDSRFLVVQGGDSGPRRNDKLRSSISTSYKPKPRMPKSTSVVGKLAEHSEMGRGVIIEDGGDILTIAFRSSGIKKVAREFIEIRD